MYPKAHAIAAALCAIFLLFYTPVRWLLGRFPHARIPGYPEQPDLKSGAIRVRHSHFKESVR